MNYLRSTYRIRAYLKFLWQSTNQHGVHSPFVYQLVTQCFYDYQFYPAYDQLIAQRNYLLQLSDLPENAEFEDGNLLEGKHRDTREMLRTSAISLKRARLINRLIRYLRVERVLELGSSLGLRAAAMATQNDVTIKSIQGSPITAEIARENFAVWGLKQLEVHTTGLSQMLENLYTGEQRPFDLVYVNSDYMPETVLSYFEQLLPFVHNKSVFVLEDIHSSAEAEIAWEAIKKHPEVRVSIDTFRWGLIFLRREQVKEHFVIRV